VKENSKYGKSELLLKRSSSILVAFGLLVLVTINSLKFDIIYIFLPPHLIKRVVNLNKKWSF
jgi:hypothetical protein